MSSRVARSRLVVLYIDSLKLGGAERITLTWASWLRDAGWSPVVLTRKPLSWDFYPVPDGVEPALRARRRPAGEGLRQRVGAGFTCYSADAGAGAA